MTNLPPRISKELKVLLSITDGRSRQGVKARIVQVTDVHSKFQALVGVQIVFKFNPAWAKAAKKRLHLYQGYMYVAYLNRDGEVLDILDEIAQEKAIPQSNTETQTKVLWMSMMNEPCARVPLSILEELRSSFGWLERSRETLVTVWSKDRRTGSAGENDVDSTEDVVT